MTAWTDAYATIARTDSLCAVRRWSIAQSCELPATIKLNAGISTTWKETTMTGFVIFSLFVFAFWFLTWLGNWEEHDWTDEMSDYDQWIADHSDEYPPKVVKAAKNAVHADDCLFEPSEEYCENQGTSDHRPA
jgi:hypothetical protein